MNRGAGANGDVVFTVKRAGELLAKQTITLAGGVATPVALSARGPRPEEGERFVEPDIIPVSINLGDAFLLCSDGFSNYVESDEIAVLARDHWYADLPRVCTEYANKRGGDDNITVVVVLACNDRDDRRPQPAYRRTVLETLPPGGG